MKFWLRTPLPATDAYCNEIPKGKLTEEHFFQDEVEVQSPGETLLVSAAGGSVGSIVGQIGRIKGAAVIGVAGGAEKCSWVVDELGFDAAWPLGHEEAQDAGVHRF